MEPRLNDRLVEAAIPSASRKRWGLEGINEIAALDLKSRQKASSDKSRIFL
jgi:hypothetical protein